MRNTHFISKKKNAQGALRHAHFLCTIGAMGIGAKIKVIRTAKGLTLAEVEQRAGLSDGNLSRVERGKQWLTEEKIYAIAETLGVSPAAFFSDEKLVADRTSVGAAPTSDNPVVDPKHHEWLGLQENLGSDDITEFTAMIRARQERNIRLDELRRPRVKSDEELRLLTLYRLGDVTDRRFIDRYLDQVERRLSDATRQKDG